MDTIEVENNHLCLTRYPYLFESPKSDEIYCTIQTTHHHIIRDCWAFDQIYVFYMGIKLYIQLIWLDLDPMDAVMTMIQFIVSNLQNYIDPRSDWINKKSSFSFTFIFHYYDSCQYELENLIWPLNVQYIQTNVQLYYHD